MVKLDGLNLTVLKESNSREMFLDFYISWEMYKITKFDHDKYGDENE